MSFKVVKIEEVDEEEKVVRKTTKYMTKFEFTSMVALRTVQLDMGAPCNIPRTPSMKNMDIAEIEVRARIAPLAVVRTWTDGTEEVWKLNELEIIDL